MHTSLSRHLLAFSLILPGAALTTIFMTGDGSATAPEALCPALGFHQSSGTETPHNHTQPASIHPPETQVRHQQRHPHPRPGTGRQLKGSDSGPGRAFLSVAGSRVTAGQFPAGHGSQPGHPDDGFMKQEIHRPLPKIKHHSHFHRHDRAERQRTACWWEKCEMPDCMTLRTGDRGNPRGLGTPTSHNRAAT